MTVVIPPGYGQVTVHFTPGATGRPCDSVYGVAVTDSPTQAQVDTLSSALGSQYKLLLKNGGHYDGLRLLVGQDGTDPTEFLSSSGAGTTTGSGALLTPQVQILVRKVTAFAGRHNRGRTFLPDVQDASVSDAGVVNPSVISDYQANATTIFNAMTVAPWGGMVLLHDRPDREPTFVNAFVVQSKVATLRPRYDR